MFKKPVYFPGTRRVVHQDSLPGLQNNQQQRYNQDRNIHRGRLSHHSKRFPRCGAISRLFSVLYVSFFSPHLIFFYFQYLLCRKNLSNIFLRNFTGQYIEMKREKGAHYKTQTKYAICPCINVQLISRTLLYYLTDLKFVPFSVDSHVSRREIKGNQFQNLYLIVLPSTYIVLCRSPQVLPKEPTN